MRLRLASRLILGVVLVEALMLSLLVWNSVRLIGTSHAQLLEQSVREDSRLLAAALADGLAAADRAVIADALALIGDRQDLAYVLVRDRTGQEMGRIGRVPENLAVDRSFEEAEADGIFDWRQPVYLYGQYLGELNVGYGIERVAALVAKTRTQNTLIAAAEIAVSLVVTVLLGLFLTRGLRRLEEGARRLRAGDLKHRIPISGEDELADVAAAFNELASHLETTQAALEREHETLKRQTRRLEDLVNGVGAVMVEGDAERLCLTYVTREAERLLGYPCEAWLTPGFVTQTIHPDDREWVLEQIRERLDQGQSSLTDFRMRHKDGHIVWVRAVFSRGGEGDLCRGILMDVSEQKEAENRIAYLADHDSLTGLYNRRRFQEELAHQIALAQRFGHDSALLFIDLDEFKYVNDTLGHRSGDEYLIRVARLLKGSLREVDVIGRLGGDEFAVILPNTPVEDAQRLAEQLIDILRANPYQAHGRTFPISASIGLVAFPSQGHRPEELLALADAAMYRAKEQGRGGVHRVTPEDTGLEPMHAKVHWEERIRHAIAHDRFTLQFQPVVRLADDQVMHYEVLLRMIAEDGGLIPPGAFINTAERFGLIEDIDLWVLERVIALQAERGAGCTLAVNVSGRHFGSTRVLDHITSTIRRHGADPRDLIFEITETAAVGNLDQAREFIEALHDIGARVALDDFGVGYASFQYLKHLPVDMVKIDGSFVRHLDRDPFDFRFIRAINDLARGLHMSTVAEFVESEQVRLLLKEMGVDMGQGYHLGRPAPLAARPTPRAEAGR